MGRITVGGDPENYMDPPQLTIDDKDKAAAGSPFAMIFELLGIHRNVARSPKEKKPGVKTEGVLAPTVAPANDFLDATGSALASQDLANYRPLTIIDLPPSNVKR